jgi:hypothetical protein
VKALVLATGWILRPGIKVVKEDVLICVTMTCPRCNSIRKFQYDQSPLVEGKDESGCSCVDVAVSAAWDEWILGEVCEYRCSVGTDPMLENDRRDARERRKQALQWVK